MLDEIEHETLACEQRACAAVDGRQQVAGPRPVALCGEQLARHRTESLEDTRQQRQTADHQVLLRQQPTARPRALAHRGLRGATAGAEILGQRQGDERRHVRVVERSGRGQRSSTGANVTSATSTVPSARAERGSMVCVVTRAEASTSASTGSRRARVAGFASSVTAETPRPTDTPPSDLALLMAARQATATSKQPGSSGSVTAARSVAPGQGARWMLGAPVSAAKTHDQTSSLM